MENIQKAISRLMLTGVLISLLIVVFGGILDLTHHGSKIIDDRHFVVPIDNSLTSPVKIIHSVMQLHAQSIIQLGILLLVLMQVMRVGLTAYYFVEHRSAVFAIISGFIFLVLMYSLFSYI